MSVTLYAGDATTILALRIVVSPLAELGTGLHRLTAIDDAGSRWALRTWRSLRPGLQEECRLFAAMWGGYRFRLLLPSGEAASGIENELAELSATSPAAVGRLCSHALAGVDDDLSPDQLLRRARGRGFGPAAELLLSDPTGFLARLVTLLDDCWAEFFAHTWEEIEPRLMVMSVEVV